MGHLSLRARPVQVAGLGPLHRWVVSSTGPEASTEQGAWKWGPHTLPSEQLGLVLHPRPSFLPMSPLACPEAQEGLSLCVSLADQEGSLKRCCRPFRAPVTSVLTRLDLLGETFIDLFIKNGGAQGLLGGHSWWDLMCPELNTGQLFARQVPYPL